MIKKILRLILVFFLSSVVYSIGKVIPNEVGTFIKLIISPIVVGVGVTWALGLGKKNKKDNSDKD